MKYTKGVDTRFAGYWLGLKDMQSEAYDQYYCSGAVEDAGMVYLVLHTGKLNSEPSKRRLDRVVLYPLNSVVEVVIERAGEGEAIVYDDFNNEFLFGPDLAKRKRSAKKR